MRKIELFNLYVGDSRIPKSNVGPFIIDFKPNYENLISCMYQPEQIITEGFGLKYIKSEQQGKWIPTADLWMSDDKEISVLRDPSINDGGVWDICQILSFITGRCVCTIDQIDTKNYKKITGEIVCNPIGTILSADEAWRNRNKIA